MAINKKFIHFKRKSTFRRELEAGNILNTSIVFIADAKQIYLNGSYFSENTLFNLSDLLSTVSGDLTSTDTSNEAIVKLYKQLQEVDTNTNDLIKILMQEVSTLEGTLTNRIDNTDLTLATELSRIDQEMGNLENLVNITYSKLKSLRDSSKLIPGRWYRITDFVTTVANDPEAQSAGHPFDIIVMASDKNKLQDECYAINHEGDTYFANCNLAAWKIWYCLDNDTTKYTWADTVNGKGVIYHMIDEWQNDCPYDFKNIMFNRTVTAGTLNINGAYYTFSWVNEANEVEDASIVGQTLTNDAGNVNGVHDNLISVSAAERLGINGNTMAFALNGNVFVSEYSYEGGLFYGIYGNHFATNCYNNTFGSYCFNNSFGDNCYGNTFGYDCYSNTFGDSCNSNSFGDNFSSNTFGYDCYSNTFGNDCYSNSFGNGCYDNLFGNDCDGNSFGNSFYRNSFGNYCINNSFGDNCYGNTFGYGCNSNSFGEDCNNNTFGNSFQSNAIGNEVLCIKIPTEKIYYTHILNGTKGTSTTNKLTIKPTPNANYPQYVARNSSGAIKIWNPADLNVIAE